MEDLAPLRDEVNEPLGLLPGPDRRAVARTGWKMLPLAAPAAVAIAMAAFTFGLRGAQPRGDWFAARTEAPPAPVRAEPPSPGSAGVDSPARPPISTADQNEAASSVKDTRQGDASAPIPLIIDVQQALAAAKAKAAPLVPR